MKNSLAVLTLSMIAALSVPSGADTGRYQTDQVAMANVPGSPLMGLPGMRALPRTEAFLSEPLPQPLISDVTNAPNPFDSRTGQTQIAYRLDRDAPVTVTLYDLLGQRVRRWSFAAGPNGGRQGSNTFLWDGTNETGRKVSKGGYLAQIEVLLPGATAIVIRKIGVIH